MERRPEPSDSPRSETVVDARTRLALWLRAGRAHRGMSLDDVAKVTKIQPRILERIEAGRLDGLPAEVFVRGFVRSFARCVGLDECEALRRYAACAIGSQDLTPTVRALVEAMADLAPGSATAVRATPRKMHAVEVIDLAGPVVLASPAESEPSGGPGGMLAEPSPPAVAGAGALVEADPAPAAPVAAAAPLATAVEAPPAHREVPDAQAASQAGAPAEPIAASEPPPTVSGSPPAASEPATSPVQAAPQTLASRKKRSRRRKAREAAAARAAAGAVPSAESCDAASGDDVSREPVAATPAAPQSAPWRRLVRRTPTASTAPSRPSLVIDDADPESAERVQEERAEHADTLAPRRSFLPPILLDREDRSARQGGLTLAVILLLIAATLTLSYLMRRPSASGDGMTGREAPVQRAERG
jgi:hypothetical protein